MRVRSLVLGLLGVAFMCGFSFFNDRVLRQTFLVGNSMPASVYSLLIVLVLLVNPLLNRVRRGLSFSAGELSVALAITLAVSPIPGSGLLRTFTSTLIMPVRYEKTIPAWSQHRMLERVPSRFLPAYQGNDVVEEGYVNGLGVGSEHVALDKVPWGAWVRPFAFWLPLVALLWFAMLCLGVVLHQQWCHHEHIPYPIASFAELLLPDGGDGISSLFRNRLFWAGCLLVLLIHVNNYLQVWFPDKMIPVRLSLPLGGFGKVFPLVIRGGGGSLFYPHIFFVVIGLCFLLPAEVSFSFAIAPWLWAMVCGVLAGYGINLATVVEGSSYYCGVTPRQFMLFGACLGLFLAICYTGRHYYCQVFLRALGFRRYGSVTVAQRWCARGFMAFTVAFAVYLCLGAGLDWQLAVMYTMVLVGFYVVMSRIICETGLFHLQLNIFPCVIILGFLGIGSVGPTDLLIMQLISMVLVCDPRESLMPIMMNSLKVADRHRQPLGRMTGVAGLAMVIGLAIALPITLYLYYDMGGAVRDNWGDVQVPKLAFSNAITVEQKLMAQGTLEASERISGWDRLLNMQPDETCMICLLAGAALVLACSYGRLRIKGWPIHPVLFVTWNTPHMAALAGSFLIGWLVKVIILKYAGHGMYTRMKPLMVGLIAGELLGAFIPSVTAAIYYFCTNEQPPAFRVLLS